MYTRPPILSVASVIVTFKVCKYHLDRFSKLDAHRLDVVWYQALHGIEEYKHLWLVVSRILVMSHGQASVERGFSENKQAMEVNQKGDSLIARRRIKDHIRYVGGVENVVISEGIMKSCTRARSRYRSQEE